MKDQVECFARPGVKDALLGSEIGNAKDIEAQHRLRPLYLV
jgi:hypothetical protein